MSCSPHCITHTPSINPSELRRLIPDTPAGRDVLDRIHTGRDALRGGVQHIMSMLVELTENCVFRHKLMTTTPRGIGISTTLFAQLISRAFREISLFKNFKTEYAMLVDQH